MGIIDRIKDRWQRYVNWRDRMSVIWREDRQGWIICIAVLVITIIRSGLTYSFGVFVEALEMQYKAPLLEQSKTVLCVIIVFILYILGLFFCLVFLYQCDMFCFIFCILYICVIW